MVSIRVQVEEGLRESFFDACRKHTPRVSMNAAIAEFIAQVVSGQMKLPAGAIDGRIDPDAKASSPRPK